MQQSAAFKILRTRLKTVPSYSFNKESRNPSTLSQDFNNMNMNMNEEEDSSSHNMNMSNNGINFASWLQRFQQKQHQHRLHSKTQARSFSRNISISSKVS